MHLFFTCSLICFLATATEAAQVKCRVLEVMSETRTFKVDIFGGSSEIVPSKNNQIFRVGAGDLEIGYEGRTIRANAVEYADKWHLEQIFPLDGLGAKAARDVNRQLRLSTATMSRRKYVKEGDYIPNFAMIDQNGEFLQIRQLQGKPFILNFIFTRCAVPKMCPASSKRMSVLQDTIRDSELSDLQFVTISFDPEFDSPGILRQYAQGYTMESENFHLLTGDSAVVDDLLRQFGIVTMEEDGTINHTMATLLIDRNGRVTYRKEGTTWTIEEFLKASEKL